MEKQDEFLFAGGPEPEMQPPDPRAGFYREVAGTWGLPVGQKIHLLLRRHDLSDVVGILEMERAPDLPLNPKEPLRLSAGGVAFLSTQVQSWNIIG